MGPRSPATALLLLLALGGCPLPECCEPEPLTETLLTRRDGEVRPDGADAGAAAARIGWVGSQPAQMLIEFEDGRVTGSGTYVNHATLSFYVAGVVGDPEGQFGGAQVELVRAPLGDPLTEADFDASSSAAVGQTTVALLPAGRMITVDVTAALVERSWTYDPIVFRISFPNAGPGAGDAFVWVETTEAGTGRAPTLFIDGGILGY